MVIGAIAEPLVVVTLLFGGAWFNRNTFPNDIPYARGWGSPDDLERKRPDSDSDPDSTLSSPRSTPSLLRSGAPPPTSRAEQPQWRNRRLRFPGYSRMVTTPNTTLFQDRLLSRLLRKFPFLVEAWYWALIYWSYQVGRAFTALMLVDETVNVARQHALQLIHVEQAFGIFVERPVQDWFLQHPNLLRWINRIYSYIHIPGTILFLVLIYYFTTTRKRRSLALRGVGDVHGSAGPALYEARRRTMALCNLIAFIVFTLWPCMPPRLLSDPEYDGPDAQEAKSFGFIDTVHSAGEKSVWTANRFCNQYAAMPSLHFGYSLLVGLTVATFPISGLRPLSWKRITIAALGLSYPTLILTVIIATANHFVLDAMAGAMVCVIAWNANGILLNLLILEDYFLWFVRIHKPVNWTDQETAVEPEYRRLISEEI